MVPPALKRSTFTGMEITRIEPTGRDRARIYVDGEDEPHTELAWDLVVRAGLAAGDFVAPDRVAELVRDDERYRARDAALRLLGHRMRSRAELRRRLGRKEFPVQVIDETLDWLEARDYVDDRAFAEAFVRDRIRLKPRGRFGLLRELGRKGIDDAVAGAAVDAVLAAQQIDEKDLARQAAAAWARKNRGAIRTARGSREGRLKAHRRLYSHLARRGFPPDAAREAIAAVLDQ